MRSRKAGWIVSVTLPVAIKSTFREIVDDSQVVIAEGVVLLGVENLEQGGRRIAPDVRTELVDLVEHEDRVSTCRPATIPG